MAFGQAVVEFEPEGKGAQEIREVYNYISQLLGKLIIRREDYAEAAGKSR
jgi:hypothetical protein